MSKFKKAVMLHNKEEWQHYQKDMITELNMAADGSSLSIQLPKSPESYPCLVYTTLLPLSQNSDSVTHAEIACCYVYTDNAEELVKLIGPENLLDFFSSLESKLATDNTYKENYKENYKECHNYEGHKGREGVEGSDEEDDDDDEEIIFDDDAYLPVEDSFKADEDEIKIKKGKTEDYVPASAGVLLLTLVSELRSIGALRLDRMMETAKEVEKWMVENKEENLQSDLWELLKRLWDKKDAS
jgi:hypothetical protein